MKALILAGTCLIALSAPAFAQDPTSSSPIDSAPTAPITVIQRGGDSTSTTAKPMLHRKHRMHRHSVATQQSGENLSTEVRPRAATATPTPGSSVLGNRSDDPAGPTTVITH